LQLVLAVLGGIIVRAKVVLFLVFQGLFTVFCGALPTSALAQKLYKHVDANGVVTYSDRPDTVGEKKLAVSNIARVGDRTDAINENMQNMSAAEERAWRQKQADADRKAKRQTKTSDADSDDSSDDAKHHIKYTGK
jgi:hypothetical protein